MIYDFDEQDASKSEVANANTLYYADFTQTGISDIVTETPADTSIYDLSGRRVENPKKGVYIVNGQKQVLK